MPAALNITAPGLPAFQSSLANYIAVSKKIPGEVVARKGVDVRIKMFQAMRQRQYRKGRKGGVWREQKRRFKSGRGMLVRDRSFQSDGVDKNGRKLNRWQAAVKGEAERRERGIGVLSVTFLDRRWRKPRKGHYLSRNQSRSLGTMMVTEQTKDTFHITATTPGVAEVAERYGAVNQALYAVTADMDKYLTRKANEAAQKTLGLYKKK
jgi:hypothetical protein